MVPDEMELGDESVRVLDDEQEQQVLADDVAVWQVSYGGELVWEQGDILEQVDGTVLELDVEQDMLPGERVDFDDMMDYDSYILVIL